MSLRSVVRHPGYVGAFDPCELGKPAQEPREVATSKRLSEGFPASEVAAGVDLAE